MGWEEAVSCILCGNHWSNYFYTCRVRCTKRKIYLRLHLQAWVWWIPGKTGEDNKDCVPTLPWFWTLYLHIVFWDSFFFLPCWLRLLLNFCLVYILFRKMFVNRRKLFHFFLEIFRDTTTVLLAIFKVQRCTIFRNFPIFSLISLSLVASGKRVFPFQHLQSELCWTVLFFFLCSPPLF